MDSKGKALIDRSAAPLESVYDILRLALVIDLTQRHKGVCIMGMGKGRPKKAKAPFVRVQTQG